MKVEVELSDVELQKLLTDELRRRVSGRMEYHATAMRDAVDERIRDLTADVVSGLDLAPLVRQEVESVFQKVLTDTVRHQVRSIVRLAVQQELATRRAEFQDEREPPAELVLLPRPDHDEGR